jgi:chromosome condensin MukBEF complex kleisin-like MukF subunit
MQSARQPLTKRRPLHEAETIVDKARAAALKVQFGRAVSNVTKALDLEEKMHAKRQKKIARQLARERKLIAKDMKAAIAERRKLLKEREKTYKERQKWWKRADLTMEDMMRGPLSRSTTEREL